MFLSFALLIFTGIFAKNLNYNAVSGLKAVAYPAHVEISWKNNAGFNYEVYCSTDNGKKFNKLAETDLDNYFDFVDVTASGEKLKFTEFYPKVLVQKELI